MTLTDSGTGSVITGKGDGAPAPRDNAARARIAAIFMRFVEAMEK